MKHHFLRRLGAFALSMVLALSCAAPAWADDPDPDTPPVKVTQIMQTTERLSLTVGQTHTLTAEVWPEDATNKTLRWSSSRPDIADVDQNGKVTAKAPGDAVVTVEAEDGSGVRADCAVKVAAAAPSLKLEPSPVLLEVGQKAQVKAVTTGIVKNVTWESNNREVTVTRNDSIGSTVTLESVGQKATSATITVKATFELADGKEKVLPPAYLTVTVADDTTQRVENITLNKEKISIVQGGAFQLTATLTPSNAASKAVSWSSSDPNVAAVDPATGLVTAKGAGKALITAKPRYGNKAAYCTVTVTPAAEEISSLAGTNVSSETAAGKTTYTLTYGRNSSSDFAYITAYLAPSDSEDPVQWKTKDATIAMVAGKDNTATVTRRGAGTTKITAVPLGPDGKPREGVKAVELEVVVSGVTLDKNTLTLGENRQDSIGYKAHGDAATNGLDCEWMSTDPAVVDVDPKTGVLTARGKGTAVVTVTKGTGKYYTAACTVTVVEDASGIITLTGSHPAGSPVSLYSASASSAAGSGTLASVLDKVCREKTKVLNADGSYTTYGLSYVTSLSVASTDQGILHDQHHSTDDTGAGVGIRDMYYPNGNTSQGQRSLKDLSFVPRTTFSGTAEINYTGHSNNNQTFTGVIRVSVNGTGDVMYNSSEGSVVRFLADDFNLYHPSLRSVSFTPPLENRGTLYYDYSNAEHPGTKVTASDVYNRTGTPSLDRVAFVPAAGYEGTVTISYKGADTAGRSITGTVTITVTNNRGSSGAPGDIYYTTAQDSWVTFRPSDFSAASRNILGETLSYVRFSPPPSSDGTLFYNYRGFGNFDSTVAPTTSYYYSGTPSLGSVTFVPTTTTPSQVDIGYTGYTVRGNTFTGTIHIGKNAAAQQQGGLRYTVFTGKSVHLSAYDFNAACVAATGASLNYVQFSPLPAVGEGALRYTWGNSSTTYSLSTSTRCYRSRSNTWDVQLDNVFFLANTAYTGTVTIPFVGYNTSGTSFTGEVIITVTPPTTGDSVYYGTTASPIPLSSSRMRSACSGVLDGTLSYITFTTLPGVSTGRLYLNYSSFNNKGTQVNTGTRYYAASSPGIDQISFVPRGRYNGQVSVGYTATSTSGRSVTGLITFNITSTAASSYFSDMGGHTWAAPAVDYLYRNGVTNGVTATTYGPDEHISRADFVLMLCRAFRFSGGSGYSFADVPAGAYYADAVATAKQLGIVNGDGRNFMPTSDITRQDAMVIIKNALDAAGWQVGTASTSILSRFPDGTSVSNYARGAASTLVQLGAVNGDNGMLYPHNSITRAEAAMILHFVMTL